MCFGMNCPYEKYNGECSLTFRDPRYAPFDAVCASQYWDEDKEDSGEPQGVTEMDPNTD